MGLDPDFIFSHIQLGVTQYKMGSIASSMATFRRCIKNFDKTPDVYNYYGELLLDQGKFQEAIEKFDAAIELEKETKPTCMNVLPLINKSLAVFQSKNDFAEAEKLCEKALISMSPLQRSTPPPSTIPPPLNPTRPSTSPSHLLCPSHPPETNSTSPKSTPNATSPSPPWPSCSCSRAR